MSFCPAQKSFFVNKMLHFLELSSKQSWFVLDSTSSGSFGGRLSHSAAGRSLKYFQVPDAEVGAVLLFLSSLGQ